MTKKEIKKLYSEIANEQPYCQYPNCKTPNYMTEIHHIIFGSLHGTRDSLTYRGNLICLCKHHHILAHKHKKKYIPILQNLINK